MRRHWKTLLIVAVVAAVALSVVAVAMGVTKAPRAGRMAGGACGALMSNPEAFKAMQDLRFEHQQEMQAWYDKYGTDRSSAEGRSALQKLRQEHRNDMKALFDKFGIAPPQGSGVGRGMMGSGGCGGACGGPGSSAQGTGYGMMGSGGGMMGGWSY